MDIASLSSIVMSRPPLHDYAVRTTPGLIVETYRSEAGQMRACSGWHRITLNRSSHRRYAHRFGDHGPVETVPRPRHTLGFEPAGMPLFVDGDEADYLSIFVEPSLYHADAMEAGATHDQPEHARLVSSDPVTLQVLGALALLARSDRPDDPLLVEQLGRALVLSLRRLLDDRRPDDPPLTCRKLGNVQLKRVIAHIEENLGDSSLGVADLAAVAHVSPFHFSRAFKASLGRPPHRFLVERRLERAKALILETTISLAEIAIETGFADQAHLSAVFRRETGTTPGRFRSNR